MLKRYTIKTERRGLYNITSYVRQAVTESGVQSGIAVVFCPHTTAAITINENADPDVKTDLLYALEETFPNRPQFRHAEGNSDAHMKSSCVGASETVIIDDNELLLGTWQGIYFAEFDGPRTRNFFVKIILNQISPNKQLHLWGMKHPGPFSFQRRWLNTKGATGRSTNPGPL